MAVDKLPEFAKNGQQNTDGLNLEDGFPVNLKPARQWFNFLFNKLTLSINQIIDEDYIRHNEIVDNLNAKDLNKPLSANQGKVLNEKKVDIGKSFSDSFAKDVDYYQDEQTEQYFKSFDDFPLGSRVLIAKNLNLVNAPNLGDIYIYVETKTTYMKINPGRVQIAHGYANGSIAVRSAPTNAPYGEWKYIANTQSNVASATKLATARKINTIDFDGTKDISVPTIDAVDNLTSSDTKKPLSANQGRVLNEQKLNKDTEQSSYKTDKGFLDKYASRNTPSFFFDAGDGKFFDQFTVGVASSLDTGAYFILGASPINNKVKVMSGVRRENGTYALQKNLTLLDSESNNVVNGDFVWDNHKNGGWARGLVYKAKSDSTTYAGFGASGSTDTLEKIYMAIGGDNIWSSGNGKGIWIDQNGAYSNSNWTFTGEIQVGGPVYAQKFRDDGDFWFTSKDENTAKRLLTGGLLASNAFADSSRIPINGIFSKGNISSNGYITIDAPEAQFRHESTGRYLFINGGGWGVYSNNGMVPLSVVGGGTGNSDGRAPSAERLAYSRNISISGAVSGNANFDGSGNINISTSLQAGIGINQSFNDLTASRVSGVVYTNNTGKPIFLIVTAAGSNNTALVHTVDGYQLINTNESAMRTLSYPVPNGFSYMITAHIIYKWIEIR